MARTGTGAAILAAAAVTAAVAAGSDRPELPVSVDAEVYPVLSELIEIRPGHSVSFVPEVITLARLSLDSQPQGAEVTLDGERRGHTPVLIEDLVPGSYELVIRESAHATFRRKLRVDLPHR